MEIICCNCKRFIGYKYPYSDTRQTHGYCQVCYAEEKRRINNEARIRMEKIDLPDHEVEVHRQRMRLVVLERG